MGLEKLKARMHVLGMKPVLTAGGRLEGQAPFRNLVNAFTHTAILAANVRDFGEDAVAFTWPPHLTHLPAIRLLALPSAAAFEAEVQGLYQRRLEKLHEANGFLAALKLSAELDEPGFRVVSETWVGNEVVRFTLRQGGVVQVLAVAGFSLDGKIDPRLRRVDASKVRTAAALERALEPLLVQIGATLAGAGRVEVEAEDTGEFEARVEEGEPAPKAVAKPAQSDLFDHGFTGVLAEDPIDQDTFGGFEAALRERAEDNAMPLQRGSIVEPEAESGGDAPQVVDSSGDAPLMAMVCAECGSFYLVEEHPADARLLDTCPRCLGLNS